MTQASRLRSGLRWSALLVACSLLAAACGGGGGRDDDGASDTTAAGGGGGEESQIIDASQCTSDPTAGITGNEIKLGISLPQSGLYSAFKEILAGSKAYFDYLNEELGGVEVAGQKYTISLVDYDDEYKAEKTVSNVQRLIDSDEVFALFNVVGTKNNLAIRDTVNDDCVPDLFAATGSPAWGNPEYPWLLGTFLVPYPLEVHAFVEYLKANKPDATVAVLRANDDFGRAYSETFAKEIEGTDITLAKEEVYDPEVPDTKSQVTSLAATGADAFLVGATLLACPDALKNAKAESWTPITYMSGTCTSKTLMALAGDSGDGVLSVAPLLDPANPENDAIDAVALYKEKVAQYEPEADVTNGIVAYGWSAGAALAELLSRSETLDRPTVMETARTLTDLEGIGLQLPGATWSVSADDWFLGEQFSLVQYSLAKGYFELIGDLVKADGETAEIAPEALVTG